MSKLVPSPDWFVGLDSLDLCKNGHFVDKIQVEVRISPNILRSQFIRNIIYIYIYLNI